MHEDSSYASPEMIEVGPVVELTGGGGGMSGQDVQYYWYYNTPLEVGPEVYQARVKVPGTTQT